MRNKMMKSASEMKAWYEKYYNTLHSICKGKKLKVKALQAKTAYLVEYHAMTINDMTYYLAGNTFFNRYCVGIPVREEAVLRFAFI